VWCAGEHEHPLTTADGHHGAGVGGEHEHLHSHRSIN